MGPQEHRIQRMSKTGRYAVRNGKVVKLSDRIPHLPKNVYLPSGGKFYEEFNDSSHPHGQWIDNKHEKRRVMKKLNLAEV